MKKLAIATILASSLLACENRSLTESEEFKPREIHENIKFNFDEIVVDGVEYLILEKDNNNPHEGFGFMAFRANKLIEKQDSLIAYNQAILEMQSKIYARLSNTSEESASDLSKSLFDKFLQMQQSEITTLEETGFSGSTNPNTSVSEEQDEN